MSDVAFAHSFCIHAMMESDEAVMTLICERRRYDDDGVAEGPDDVDSIIIILIIVDIVK
jgi:hypothetical protein